MSTSPNPVVATERQRAKSTTTPKETDDANTLPKPTLRELENHQLALFQTVLCKTDEERDRISHAIELWDNTPRYSFNRKAMNKARVNGQFLEPQELSFHYRGGKYTLTVSPARLKDADGVFRDYFPGATEELVEECLRKRAIEKQSGYFDRPNHRSGVLFSLGELRRELVAHYTTDAMRGSNIGVHLSILTPRANALPMSIAMQGSLVFAVSALLVLALSAFCPGDFLHV